MKIDLCIGMIASGKSTYARGRASDGAIIVEHDAIIAGIHGVYRYVEDLHRFYHAVEENLADLALDSGRDVIVDRTHLTLKSRRRWIEFARLNHVPITAVLFPVDAPEIHATRRYETDARGLSYEHWLRVARHHHAQAKTEPLDRAEGFDHVVHVRGVG